ncbi:GNAT family N-acetyltransferase [Alphaproteobacteria bacterium GH1-50]|uniref:GNAT family N-acetyltransferase n=1 Tax=Kangsaoukella pontilimi TaxID=2691042 RepID=A0A7C9ITU2_9RHOB|nr:GNAT family N-acetyltransferase [Kangsaoukella pontilimi]MXQ09125.1 GNAT family N-acetyltransferase [Kangsaoukella pontilimi]
MRASSPACSVHAMEAGDLVASGARFFAVMDGDEAVAMGALKRLASGGGEVKSMHVREDRRGRGLADLVLGHLLDVARTSGMPRLFLETGSQDAFRPARAFYARHGFAPCPPFEGYAEDPNSVFMTRAL